jgi:hypothetical protein
MISMFDSVEELITHASTNFENKNFKECDIFLEELEEWHTELSKKVEVFYKNTAVKCHMSEENWINSIIDLENKIDNLNVLINKYEQKINVYAT